MYYDGTQRKRGDPSPGPIAGSHSSLHCYFSEPPYVAPFHSDAAHPAPRMTILEDGCDSGGPSCEGELPILLTQKTMSEPMLNDITGVPLRLQR